MEEFRKAPDDALSLLEAVNEVSSQIYRHRMFT